MRPSKQELLFSVILLLILAGFLIGSGFASLNTTEYANGWDAYYYLIQVQSINTTGVMHSPEYSLVYLPVTAIHAITNDYVASYRASAVLIKTLFVFSVFTLGFTLLRLKISDTAKHTTVFFTALTAASISAISPSLNYFFAQFPKNLLGFALLFFFISSVYRTDSILDKSKNSGEKIPAVKLFIRFLTLLLLFIATYFTHRFSAVLSLFFLLLNFAPRIPHLFHYLWTPVSAKQGSDPLPCFQRHRRKLLLLPLTAVVLLYDKLSLALSFKDLEVVTSTFSNLAVFSPVAFIETFGSSKLSTAWITEILLAGVLPVITGVLLLKKRQFNFLRLGKQYYILIIIALTGLFPFFSFSLTSLSYRLLYTTLLIFPLLLIPYLYPGVQKLMNLKQNSSAIPVILFLLILAFYPATGRSYNPQLHDPPYAFYEELAGETVIALADTDYELIIAHKALAEMITFSFQVDALPWAPEDYFQRDRVWRITAGIMKIEIAMYLGPQVADQYFFRLSGDYGLLREDYWEAFLDSIADEPVMIEAVTTWRNPYQQRPAYMRKTLETTCDKSVHLKKSVSGSLEKQLYR